MNTRLIQLAGLTESGKSPRQQAALDATLGKFRPPFSQSGNWVNDSRGTSVCEMTPDVAKLIAEALNFYVANKAK